MSPDSYMKHHIYVTFMNAMEIWHNLSEIESITKYNRCTVDTQFFISFEKTNLMMLFIHSFFLGLQNSQYSLTNVNFQKCSKGT